MPHSDLYVGGVAAVRKMLEAGGAASGLAMVLELERPDLVATDTVAMSLYRDSWNLCNAGQHISYGTSREGLK